MKKYNKVFFAAVLSIALSATTSVSAATFSLLGDGAFTGDLSAAGLTATGTVSFTHSSLLNAVLGTNSSGQVISTTSPAVQSIWAIGAGGTSYFAGKVGIATTSPGSIFAIQGVGNFVANGTSTITSTGGGINLTSGCYAVNGVCISGGGGNINKPTVESGGNSYTEEMEVYRTYSVTQGSTIVASASCPNDSGPRGLTLTYRFATDSATSTGYDNSDLPYSATTGFMAITATTTNTLAINIRSSGGQCNRRDSWMIQFNP